MDTKSLRFSKRQLLYMIFPVIVNDLTSIFVNTVDAIMVSSTGETSVSAISLVGSLNEFFLIFLITLGIGCSVVVSQYIGANKLENARSAAKQSVYIGLVFSIPMCLLLLLFSPSLLRLVYPAADPTVMEKARIYYLLIIPSIPFIGAQQMFTGVIRAMGKNRLILILGLVQNVLNIIGNAILIYGFKLGVVGAAIATTLSYIICSVISYLMVRNKKLQVHIRGLLHPHWDSAEVKRVLTIGLGAGADQGLMALGKVLVSSMYSGLSPIAISAFYVSRSLCNFGWTTLNGFGTVLMTVVGQCIGGEQADQAKYYTKKFLYMSLPLNFAIYGILFFFRELFVLLYGLSEETLHLAAQYVGIGSALTMLCLFPLAIMPPYAFRAAGDTRYTAISSTAITFICQVGLCYVFVSVLNWGIPGVWLSLGIDWIVRDIFFTAHFIKGKWMTKKVV